MKITMRQSARRHGILGQPLITHIGLQSQGVIPPPAVGWGGEGKVCNKVTARSRSCRSGQRLHDWTEDLVHLEDMLGDPILIFSPSALVFNR